MPGKIEVYVDCASVYSYFAIKYLREQRPLLAQYEVEVEFIPFFLGGVNHATGNQPPSTLPARARYLPYDLQRAVRHFKTVPLSGPSFFPLSSLLPQRAMLVIKAKYPREQFESFYEQLWIWVFNKHVNIGKPDEFVKLLGQHFAEPEVKEIMQGAQNKEVKDQLNANTKAALERGAYGAPWFWLMPQGGKEEPVFGSDRFAYVFLHMGVETRQLEIVDKQGEGSKARL